LRLYHMPGSRSSRVLWALEEAGATYDLTVLTRDEKRSDAHAKRHPLRRVPVLELDDGRFIFESAAIALHIGDTYPEAGLLPAIGDPLRPEAYQWTVFAMSELEPAVFGWRRARREEKDETEAAERFAPIEVALANILDRRTWLLGDTFTMPDVLVATILGAAVSSPLGDPSASIRAYVERAQQRPAYLRAEELGRRKES
jgi:glutathione S-transferase